MLPPAMVPPSLTCSHQAWLPPLRWSGSHAESNRPNQDAAPICSAAWPEGLTRLGKGAAKLAPPASPFRTTSPFYSTPPCLPTERREVLTEKKGWDFENCLACSSARVVGFKQGWVMLKNPGRKALKHLSVKSAGYHKPTHERPPRTITAFSSTAVQEDNREMLLKVQISLCKQDRCWIRPKSAVNNAHVSATSHYLFTNTGSNRKLRPGGCHLFRPASGRRAAQLEQVSSTRTPISFRFSGQPLQLLNRSPSDGVSSYLRSFSHHLFSFQCAPLRRFYFHCLCNLTFEGEKMQLGSPLDFSPAKPSRAPLPCP